MILKRKILILKGLSSIKLMLEEGFMLEDFLEVSNFGANSSSIDPSFG